jgi:hypothetical protein
MAEWLILLLLVPAIVVPAVLLLGFAGCHFTHGTPSYSPPIIDSADGKDVETITLTWYGSGTTETYLFTRTSDGGPSKDFIAPANPNPTEAKNTFDDHDGLAADTTYTYVVRALYGDGSTSDASSPKSGKTLAFATTFDETDAFSADSTGWEGFTLVQRIEAAALMPISRTQVEQVRITLYASSMGDASIDRIFISQPDPASTAKPYDSATDLTAVPLIVEGDTMPSMPLVVPANKPKTLRGVNYIVQPQSQPLLIAVDFTALPTASAVRQAVNVPPARAVAYWRLGAEAALRNRSAGYTPDPSVYLVGKIEIG